MSSVPPKTPGEAAGLRFWWLREDEQIRGPYTGKQMLAFLLKGRIRPATLVRPDTEREWRPASEEPEFARYLTGAMPAYPPEAGPARHMPSFVIMVDGGACPAERIEAVIGELGPCYRLTADVWLLQCGLQLEKIRTYLVRQLAAIERLFIIDTRSATYAGYKFGNDLDQHVRKLIESGEADVL